MSDSREGFANNIVELMNRVGRHAMNSQEAEDEWERMMASQGAITINTSKIGELNNNAVLKREQLGTLEKEGRQK